MRVWAEAVLPAEPEAAWPRLLAWERQPEWMRDADRVRVVTPQREGRGVRVAVRTRILGVPLFTETLEVTEWDRPRLLRLAHRGFVRGFGEWSLHPTSAGTRLRWTEDLSIPVPILGELALLAYRPVMRRLMRASLAGLRRQLLAN